MVLISSSDSVLCRKYKEQSYILINPSYKIDQNIQHQNGTKDDHIQHAIKYVQETNYGAVSDAFLGNTRKYTSFRSLKCAEITESLEIFS